MLDILPSVTLLIKGFVIVFSLIYLIYSIVIYGQIQGMAKTLETDFEWIVVAGTLVQLVVAAVILVLSFVLI